MFATSFKQQNITQSAASLWQGLDSVRFIAHPRRNFWGVAKKMTHSALVTDVRQDENGDWSLECVGAESPLTFKTTISVGPHRIVERQSSYITFADLERFLGAKNLLDDFDPDLVWGGLKNSEILQEVGGGHSKTDPHQFDVRVSGETAPRGILRQYIDSAWQKQGATVEDADAKHRRLADAITEWLTEIHSHGLARDISKGGTGPIHVLFVFRPNYSSKVERYTEVASSVEGAVEALNIQDDIDEEMRQLAVDVSTQVASASETPYETLWGATRIWIGRKVFGHKARERLIHNCADYLLRQGPRSRADAERRQKKCCTDLNSSAINIAEFLAVLKHAHGVETTIALRDYYLGQEEDDGRSERDRIIAGIRKDLDRSYRPIIPFDQKHLMPRTLFMHCTRSPNFQFIGCLAATERAIKRLTTGMGPALSKSYQGLIKIQHSDE